MSRPTRSVREEASTGSVRSRLARLAFVPAWTALTLAIPVAVLGVDDVGPAGRVTLLAMVVLTAVPHRALDYQAVRWLRRGRRVTGSLGRFLAVYAAIALLAGVAWLVAPGPTLVGCGVLAWVHFGQSDVYPVARLAGGDHLDGRALRLATVAVRGGLPILTPIAVWPEQSRALLELVVVAGLPAGWADVAVAPGVRWPALGGLALVAVGTLALGFWRSGDDDGWRIDAAETGLLALFFTVVPPLLSLAVYVGLWHSLRHVARVVAVDDAATDALATGAYDRVLRRVAAPAVPATAAVLAVAFGVAVFAPGAVAGERAVTVTVVAIAALSVPHAIVVAVLDRVEFGR